MALIRCLTLHLRSLGGISDYTYVRDELYEKIDIVKRLTRDLGLNVWSFRVALPPNLRNDVQLKLSELLCRGDLLLASYHVDADSVSVDDVISVLNSCSQCYVTIKLSKVSSIPSVVELYSRLIKSLTPDDFTRIGISIPDYVETPYFPLATAYEDGFALALRYVDLFKDYLSGRKDTLIDFVSSVGRSARRLSEEAGLKLLGIDYSISPWESESVVELVESLSGVKFAYPGSGWAVKELNRLINCVTEEVGIRALGFNEVMLPVAEDDLLKGRVAEGSVTLRDLTYLSTYCLVGVDMVVLKEDLNMIKGVISDVFTASLIKNRTIGVRLIPVGMHEGSYVSLKRFGRVPVIKY
ncbi:MAG: DUF711 family protein [Sulfolobales archaeon]